MTWILRGHISVASDSTTAALVANGNSQTHAAIINLIGPVAGEIIDNLDPSIFQEPAQDAIDAAFATTLALKKCTHLASGRWAWDGPSGPSATHYILRIDGRWRTVANPFPTPSATAPAISWN